ncbi:MAG: ABC transporter permease [Dysgonamonadaceae bacterium]|jgi:ABC-type antimicrobial peptide transport system permease subunit|nr:ABC transporter permease [Dysgonamonadaceae bacterium]
MKKIAQYFRPALYNIMHNKGYALFCILGTALTFIFITLVLQLMRINGSNYPPMTHADRIVRLEYFNDTEGKGIGGIRDTETNAFIESLNDFEHVSLCHGNFINIMANGHFHSSGVAFVSGDFWKVFDFEFLYGRPFSKEDCDNRKQVVIITEDMSRKFFNTTNGIGKKIKFQQREYEVIGIVKSPSMFASPADMCTVWTPYVFNKFIPNSSYMYTVDVLAPPTMPMEEAKEKISRAVFHYFENKNKKVDFPAQKVKTIGPSISSDDRNMLQYGGIAALFLFLLIPALNILSLGITNAGNRAEEIAVRRTFGASWTYSFFLIISENMILTAIGAIIGLSLAIPVMKVIQANIMQGSLMGNLSLVSGIDLGVIIIGVLPATIIFSLLSGGIPAYIIAKRRIAEVLKGGSK